MYHEVVQHLALLKNVTHQRGVWGFRNPTQERGPILMHEGHVEGMYEALTDLVIVHVQPLGSSQLENLSPRRGGYSQQRLYWENDATSWRAPDCDKGAREPEIVRELCTSYLPRSGALVVQGLTVAASDFDCSEGHPIRRIVVLENDPDREAYIRRQLIATHDAESEGVQDGARVVEEGTRVGVEDVHIGRARLGRISTMTRQTRARRTQVVERRTWEVERRKIWEIRGILATTNPLGI